MMYKLIVCFALISAAMASIACGPKPSENPKVLVFSKTKGWHHESIPAGNKALMALGMENNFEVDTTTNSALFNDNNLSEYSAVVFLNTTGDVLNEEQQKSFRRFIKSGGGFVGIHGAADTEHDWEWYGDLLGAYFMDHPEIQEAVLDLQEKQHLSTKHLPDKWVRTDEWYNFKDFNENVKVLLTIDEASYEGGTNGDLHPMAWYHDFDGGRAFYTGLGHMDENYMEPLYLEHLLGGLLYAIGGDAELRE